MENIDRTDFFAYNRTMQKNNLTKTEIFLLLLRILLVLASIAMTVFIFSNSLKDATVSSQQSSGVVDIVQQVASVIAPDSQIANATGEAYDLLHSIVRSMAHLLEFCLLGGLFSWTCLAHTFRKAWQLCPLAGVATVALIDECLQLATAGRAFQFTDLSLDIFGGAMGIGFAILCVWIGFCIYRKKDKKDKKREGRLMAELAAGEQPKE